jgi:hypothetical protein
MEERETSERKTEALQKKLQDLFLSLNITLVGDYGQPSTASLEKLMTYVSQFQYRRRIFIENYFRSPISVMKILY